MTGEAAVIFSDWRQSERRIYMNRLRFPFPGVRGELVVLSRRRQLPCDRPNSIAVREAAFLDYVAAIIRSHI